MYLDVTLQATQELIRVFGRKLDNLLERPGYARIKRFDDFIKPVNDTFERIHLNYWQTARDLELKMPFESVVSNEWRIPGVRGALSREQAIVATGHAVDDFHRSRCELEGIRLKLRGDTGVILAKVEDEEERGYLLSLIMYFASDYVLYLDKFDVGGRIERILKNGGNYAIDTPSIKLWEEIYEAREPEEVRRACKGFCEILNSKRIVVYREYINLSLCMDRLRNFKS